MPQFTIVVPLMDQVDAFESTLASVLRYKEQGLQIIVAHSGAYDDVHGILDEVESIVIPCRKGTSVLNIVAEASAMLAKSPWVAWLAPGIEATEGWYDSMLQSLASRSDVGMISPRVFSGEELGNGQSELGCLASCITHSRNCHPVYLEEVVGEQWDIDDVVELGDAVGPTSWAGFCRRQLLQQWSELSISRRLPNGYAELALGLFLKEEGWSHEISDSWVAANQEAQQAIETPFQRCGKSASIIMANFESGSAISKVIRSLSYAAMEIAGGILSPSKMSAGLGRLGSLSLLSQKAKRRPSVSFDDQAGIDPMESSIDSASRLQVVGQQESPKQSTRVSGTRRRSGYAA